MKKITLAFILLLSSGMMIAQESVKVQKIRQLLELTGSGKLGVQVVNQLLPSLQKNYPNVDKKFWEEFSKEIKPDELVNLIVPVYDRFYSEEDVNNLIVFYNTPTGKKMIQTMPEIMQESMRVGQQWGVKIAGDAMKRMKEKGYK